MRRTPIRWLVELAVAAALVGWLVLWLLESRGTYLSDVPWVVDVALLILAGAVFWAGWTVRAYQRGRRPDLDALRAARTYVLGKAAAVTGALLVGWYLAQVLVVLGDLDIDARRSHGVAAAWAVGAATPCSASSGSSSSGSASSRRPTTRARSARDARPPGRRRWTPARRAARPRRGPATR